MSTVRQTAVAGMFYPEDPAALDRAVSGYLDAERWSGPVPKAIIAPHAGYPFSGPVAAKAYARIAPAADTIKRVVLIGPSHRVGFTGLALSSADAYDSPLGAVPIDKDWARRLEGQKHVGVLDQAHAPEHSLEVHLPFLQKALGEFTLLPIVAGQATADQVADALEAVWGGPETLIVISSDLSHFLDYKGCQEIDAETTQAIERLDAKALGHDHACGRVGISGLLELAKRRGLSVETIDVRNSGDTAGPRDRVVGYGAWAFGALDKDSLQ